MTDPQPCASVSAICHASRAASASATFHGAGCQSDNLPPLLLAQHQVDDPAAGHMHWARVAAVVQNLIAVASGILKGVSKDRHRAEVPRLVHLLGESNRRLGAPLWGEGNRAERVTKDVA